MVLENISIILKKLLESDINLVLNAITTIAPFVLFFVAKFVDHWYRKGIRKSHREMWINKLMIDEKIKENILFLKSIERPFETKKFNLFWSIFILLFTYFLIIYIIAKLNVTGFFLMLIVAIFSAEFVFLYLVSLPKKLKDSVRNLEDSSKDFEDLFKKLQKTADRNLYSRYLVYGVLLFGVTFLIPLLDLFINPPEGKRISDILIGYWVPLTYFSLLFIFSTLSIFQSRRLEKTLWKILKNFLTVDVHRNVPK